MHSFSRQTGRPAQRCPCCGCDTHPLECGLGRDDFQVGPAALRRGLLDNGYTELPVDGRHEVAVGALPPIHKDPFDRILVAQAQIEGTLLVTADPFVARYPGPVRQV